MNYRNFLKPRTMGGGEDPCRLLADLSASEVFGADFPKRTQRTHVQLALIQKADPQASDYDRCIPYDPRFDRLVDIVGKLGKAKFDPAITTLATLWLNCPVAPLRTAAGHSLRKIGTPAALGVLIDFIEDADPFSVHLAVRSVLEREPGKAYDVLIHYFDEERVRQPGGAVIPSEILWLFTPSSYSPTKGHEWTEPRVPGWLRQDQRWLDLCFHFRRHPDLGEAARCVLRHLEPDLQRDVLVEGAKREPPRIALIQTHAVGDLFSRYQVGQCTEVWRVLRSFEAIDGDLRLEAGAVARETMRRVAHNLDLLAGRLAEKGWRSLSELRTRPDPKASRIISRIEVLTQGSLPPALLAFWQIVGGVDFAWNYNLETPSPQLHPALTLDLTQMDPLSVCPVADVEWLFEEWEEAIKETHTELLDPFSLELAPDYLHKANISGGPPYVVELPFLGADPVFAHEIHALPFVDYLRHCLRWGGFGCLDHHANEPGVTALVAWLTADFEPF